PTSRLRDRPGNTWLFEPGAASTFLARLNAQLVPDESRGREDLVELPQVTMMFISLDRVIDLVLEGKLPIRRIDKRKPGLRGLLVSKLEASDLLKHARREGHPLRAAAPLLGMTYNQLRSCWKAGLVTTTGAGTTLAVTDEALEAFRRTYIRAKEVA